MVAESGKSVGHFMHRDLEVVTEVESVVIAAERMRVRRIGSVLAISSKHCRGCGNIAGIITETDLVRKVIAQGLNASQTTVTQVMASPLLTITPDRSMLDANQLMEINQVRHLCVSDGVSIVGLISVRDLVQYFIHAESGPIRDLDDVYRPLSVLMQTSIETIDSEETLLAATRRIITGSWAPRRNQRGPFILHTRRCRSVPYRSWCPRMDQMRKDLR